jgi:sulfate transport system ATP-binding protein
MSIEARQIHKRYGGYTALDDVDLTVNDGELVALLGPSGSGKTTLLRIIAGLETADSGTVRLAGEDVTRRAVGERRVGFVFQHYALFRNMTVAGNIAFGLEVKPRGERPSKTEIAARVDELLSLIQLEGLADRYPAQLSGGQRQRVALARALAIRPRVLLLDEPFGALDAKVRMNLRRWLRKLHDEVHVTSLLVTHDQEEALEVADRVVLMRRARVEQTGTPEELFHHPASEFVLDFMGHVNLFHGRVEKGRAVFGPLVMDSAGAAEGSTARLLVRPHELDIQRQGNGTALRARVERVQLAGPLARIELIDETGNPLLVEISHSQYDAARFGAGDQVYVSPRDGRVFTEDYSI